MATVENSEWLTRKRLIDPQLKAAGWKVTLFNSDLDTAKCEPLVFLRA